VNAVLELQNVSAGYSSDVDILNDVSMEVPARGITGLVGLNGAGKSTVTKVIMGLVEPRAGRVLLDGHEITRVAPHRMAERGLWLIPQESSLYPFMSVEDNLRMPVEQLRRRTGKPTPGEIRARIDEVLDSFPMLRTKLRAQAGDLSGGQQKALEFAKAQLMKPRLCLIDEPSVGLAPKIAAEIYGHIETFAKSGVAVMIIDHNIRKVVAMADRLYVLTLGSIAAQGSGADFKDKLHDHVKEWLGISI
jgi:branched-chain amino acid transport system ATP-binding protein